MDSPKVPAKAPIEPALRALAERQRRDLGPHLEADELVAYHERQLAEAEVERMRDHLALCPECAGLLLELGAFSEPSPAGAPDLTTAEVEAAWRELAPRLEEAPPPVAQFPARPAKVNPSLPWKVLAAAMFVGVIGLSVWVVSLRHDLHDRSLPRADLVITHLRPEGDDRRSAQEGGAQVSSRHPAAIVLDLPFGLPPYSAFDVEILSPGGRVVWDAHGLRRAAAEGSIPIGLYVGSLPPGEYVVRLYGTGHGERQRVTDYPLPIQGR